MEKEINLPEKYLDLVVQFTEMSKQILGENLTGVYLHGSAAMGCFNSEESDLDLMLIVEDDITDEKKKAFMTETVKMNQKAPAKGIELSIVKRQYCNPFVYPTPFELHFSIMHLNWYHNNPDDYVERMNGRDSDLAAHFTIIRHCGIVLYGEEIENVFGQVPKADYVDSIWKDIKDAREDIWENPMYITLNLCRVLGHLKDGVILSKQTGGEWGIQNLPERFHSMIQNALDCYQNGRKMVLDETLTKEYVEYVLGKVENER